MLNNVRSTTEVFWSLHCYPVLLIYMLFGSNFNAFEDSHSFYAPTVIYVMYLAIARASCGYGIILLRTQNSFKSIFCICS